MANFSIEYRLGQLQNAVEELKEKSENAEKGRNRIYQELEQLRLLLQPLINDMPHMKTAYLAYQTDKITAKRFVYAITAIAATIGVGIGELKGWVIALLK